MTTLPDIQNFFGSIAAQLDPIQYSKSHARISTFNKLPEDFMEISIENIKQKTTAEQQLYYLPMQFYGAGPAPSVDDRRHLVFEEILAIRKILGEEMPLMVRLLFKFTETMTLKNHAITMKAIKSIWRFLLAEDIKYDVMHIEQELREELKSFPEKDRYEINKLLKIFDGLQNQLKGLKLLSEEDFSREDLLEICKTIKSMQSKLTPLIKKNIGLLSLHTIGNFEKWNEELNNSRMFITKNLHITRKAKWSELGFWGRFDRTLNISFTALAATALLVGFVALAIGTGGASVGAIVTLASLIAVGFMAANAVRSITKWGAKKINYGLPITPKEASRAIIKSILAPMVVAAVIFLHPIATAMQVFNFIKNSKKIVVFCRQEVAPVLSQFAGKISENTVRPVMNFVNMLKRNLPMFRNEIKLAPDNVVKEQETQIKQPQKIIQVMAREKEERQSENESPSNISSLKM